MTPHNKDKLRTAYTISVDAKDGVSTGISAADRAHTARVLADSATEPGDLTRPGHVFPLRYRDGGVLVRRGHTEAAVDLATLAGPDPGRRAGRGGQRRRHHEARARAARVRRRARPGDDLASRTSSATAAATSGTWSASRETRLPTAHGDFTAYGYRITIDDSEHVALVHGDVVRRRAGADPRALGVPHRRRLRQPPLRLRPPAPGGDGPHRRGGARGRSSTCAGTRDAGSAWSPSCRPTSSRTAAATPWTPTSTSACRRTRATTAPPPRCCATSGSPGCGC